VVGNTFSHGAKIEYRFYLNAVDVMYQFFHNFIWIDMWAMLVAVIWLSKIYGNLSPYILL